MLNYEVDRAVVASLVPSGTTLDSFAGKTFVSMVGFQFLDTHVLGIPVPFHRNFDEVNLRFYVRRAAADGPRRGVVFVKQIVPRVAIAWIARWLYNENYVALPITHHDEMGYTEQPRVGYEWRHSGRAHHLAVRATGSPYLPAHDSEESFITEHYWGYVRQRDGATLEYRVEHPRWRVWHASEVEFECDVASMYGAELVAYLAGPPASAFLAEGSEVTVRRGRVVVH
ncbi:MAG: DUF2071 domain-containing protein [Gemmatimonadetes bacterium]|nr:DUF2071 domain-containing protein [Gemmatimonadota bacterium]